MRQNYVFRKFSVKHTVRNEEKVQKIFQESQKDADFRYGGEMVKEIDRGMIACVLAYIDENNRMIGNQCRVFEVWSFEGSMESLQEMEQMHGFK